MRLQTVLCFLLVWVTASPAAAQTRAVQQHNLERYQAYAGEPVNEFQFWNMHHWELVGPDKVVVWTSINDAYLLTVETPCIQLEWAHGIQVTSTQHVVHRRMDYVAANGDRCPIKEIRPIDYRRMKADKSEGKSAEK